MSAQDFMSLVGLSRPVAERAAADASFVRRPTQLQFTEGVGPGGYRRLADKRPLCAEPPVPPAVADTCRSARQVDLNHLGKADRRAVARKLNVAESALDRMVREGPWASLRVAEAVAGWGPGTHRRLTQGDLPAVCVTPPSFRTKTGGLVAWITSWLHDSAASGSWALTVAAGTLKEPDGAFALVRPTHQELSFGAAPAPQAEIHLFSNSWQASGSKVWITAPEDGAETLPDVQTEQVLWHRNADTVERIRGAQLLVRDGLIIAQVSSTSIFTSILGHVWEGWRFVRGRSVEAPQGCGTAPATATVSGAVLSNSPGGQIGYCVGGDGVDLDAVLRNRAELIVSWRILSGSVTLGDPSGGNDLVPRLVASLWPGRHSSLGGDVHAGLQTPGGSYQGGTVFFPKAEGAIGVDPNLLLTAAAIAGDNLLGRILKPVEDKLQSLGIPVPDLAFSVLERTLDCVYGIMNGNFSANGVYGVIVTCVPEAIVELFDEIEDLLEDQAAIRNTLGRVGLDVDWLDDIVETVLLNPAFAAASDIASAIVDGARLYGSDRTITLQIGDARPSHLPDGTPIPAGCAYRVDGGWSVSLVCVSEQTGTPVDSGDGDGSVVSSENPWCRWVLPPNTAIPYRDPSCPWEHAGFICLSGFSCFVKEGWVGYILVDRDNRSWAIYRAADGTIVARHVPDTAIFECLAGAGWQPVRNVGTDKLNQFQQGPDMSCADSAPRPTPSPPTDGWTVTVNL